MAYDLGQSWNLAWETFGGDESYMKNWWLNALMDYGLPEAMDDFEDDWDDIWEAHSGIMMDPSSINFSDAGYDRIGRKFQGGATNYGMQNTLDPDSFKKASTGLSMGSGVSRLSETDYMRGAQKIGSNYADDQYDYWADVGTGIFDAMDFALGEDYGIGG